ERVTKARRFITMSFSQIGVELRSLLSAAARLDRAAGISRGRFDAEQMVHEEIVALALPVRAAVCVVRAWYYQQIERLVRLDQRIDDLQGRRGIDVRIELANDEQQVTLQLRRVVDVR